MFKHCLRFHSGVCQPKLGFPMFSQSFQGKNFKQHILYSDILYDNPTSLAGSSKNVFMNIDDFLVAKITTSLCRVLGIW